METSAKNSLRPLDEDESPIDHETADELVRFLRGRLDHREQGAQFSAYVTSTYRRPCPRCGKPVTGLREPVSHGAEKLVQHGGAAYTGGCELTPAEWQTFHEHGLTDEARYQLADADAKRRILEEYERHRAAIRGHNSTLDDPSPSEVRLVVSLEKVVRLLAAPFADHPDYDESWRP